MTVIAVSKLIQRALILTGEYAAMDSPEPYITDLALNDLNNILAEFTLSGINIAYLTSIPFQIQAGTSEYSFGTTAAIQSTAQDVANISYITYQYANVTRTIQRISEDEFYNRNRIENAQGLPEYYYPHFENGQFIIDLLPQPIATSQAQLLVHLTIDGVQDGGQLLDVPNSYERYLRYRLAKDLSMSLGDGVPMPGLDVEIARLEAKIAGRNSVNVALRLSSIVQYPASSGYYSGYNDAGY